MRTNLAHLIRRAVHLCAGGAMVAVWSIAALAATPVSDIDQKYKDDRAQCLNGRTAQDRPTCLREAGAARDEARRGQLNDGGANYRKNAKERCDVLTGDEQRDCAARAKGKGSVSGSVEGGGVMRETVTREVKSPEPVASAPAQ
jgi:hypothetical protein